MTSLTDDQLNDELTGTLSSFSSWICVASWQCEESLLECDIQRSDHTLLRSGRKKYYNERLIECLMWAFVYLHLTFSSKTHSLFIHLQIMYRYYSALRLFNIALDKTRSISCYSPFPVAPLSLTDHLKLFNVNIDIILSCVNIAHWCTTRHL